MRWTAVGATALAMAIAGATAWSACTSASDNDQVTAGCAPGQTQACLGPGACNGAQICASDGKSWGPCDCGGDGGAVSLGSNAGDSGSASSSGSSDSSGGGPDSSGTSGSTAGSGSADGAPDSSNCEAGACGVIETGGGSIGTGDGSGVSIPAGVIPSGSSLNVTVLPNPNAPPLPSQWTVVGTAYLFGPEGQQFPQPVTVTLAIDPAQLPADKTVNDVVILTSPGTGTPRYTALTTTVVDGTHVSAQTTHFSGFVPGALPICGEGTNVDGSGASCNAIDAIGPCVMGEVTTASPPTPTGGSIVAGTYYATSSILYGGKGWQDSERTTLVISSVTAPGVSTLGGFTFDLVHASGPNVGREHGMATIGYGTPTVYNNLISLAGSCNPSISSGQALFTATGTSLTTFASYISAGTPPDASTTVTQVTVWALQ